VNTCRSCRAEVVFIPSAKTGKPMILDAAPKKGVIIRNERGTFGHVPGGGLTEEALVVDVHTDHHATCPQAEDWTAKRSSQQRAGSA
jgi:hypothetical protein